MELNLRSLEIKKFNVELLKTFIDNLDKEKETFRYYNERSVHVISNHVYTVLLFLGDEPIAYGHLDKENDVVWLGILVKTEYQGKGVSKKMMMLLLNRANELNLKAIQLSVDKVNERAIALYRKYDFEIIQEYEDYIILRKTI